MAALNLQCNCCGKKLFIQPARKGLHQVISLAGLQGWIFTTETKCVCGEDCRASMARDVTPEAPAIESR